MANEAIKTIKEAEGQAGEIRKDASRKATEIVSSASQKATEDKNKIMADLSEISKKADQTSLAMVSDGIDSIKKQTIEDEKEIEKKADNNMQKATEFLIGRIG